MATTISGSNGLTVPQGAVYNGIASGTAQTASGTSIDFTGIPSWVKRITVIWTGLSTNGTAKKLIQLGTGTSPAYVVSGYLCSAGATSATAGSAELSTTGFMFSKTSGAADILNGSATLTNLGSNIWCINSADGLSNNPFVTICGGSVSLGAALTAVRITTVNGTDTFDAGSINILYE